MIPWYALLFVVPGAMLAGAIIATMLWSRHQARLSRRECTETRRRHSIAIRLLTPDQYRDYAKQI